MEKDKDKHLFCYQMYVSEEKIQEFYNKNNTPLNYLDLKLLEYQKTMKEQKKKEYKKYT
jgi:hypothetical protein